MNIFWVVVLCVMALAVSRGAIAQTPDAAESGREHTASDDAGWSAMIYLDAYRATGDEVAPNRAKAIVDNAYARWMEGHLLRSDNLYWCGYDASGPVGANRPNDIHEAGSVSFLGGNMGMGVIHAMLFQLTGDDKYRQRAVRTTAALK